MTRTDSTRAQAPLPRRPTQKDVARLAGVSRGTVSYVLNGQVDGKIAISQETRDRVLEAIRTLRYVPDAGARALRSGTSNTLGLIIPDFRNPHYWETANGVADAARSAGYHLLLSSMELNNQYGLDLFRDLAGRRIDALILMGYIVDGSVEAQQILTASLRRGLPIVMIRDHALDEEAVDYVISDYRSVTSEVMAHLLALGHRRIGLVYGVAPVVPAPDRLEPYRAALAVAGIAEEPSLVAECGPTMDDGLHAAHKLLSSPVRPTAIVAINDLLALAVLRAAADLGLRVPDDLSIVGFDDVSFARFLSPRLTTAGKDATLLGQEAVRLALSRLNEPDQARQVVHLPARVLLRESTAPPAGGL